MAAIMAVINPAPPAHSASMPGNIELPAKHPHPPNSIVIPPYDLLRHDAPNIAASQAFDRSSIHSDRIIKTQKS
ncbi:MAG: hypothetical protein KDJ29_01130 [Hyphomicrobiales bacterium]|nr:hypothetical protein [Hyphomicrobiales bacterium]